jgi:predicted nucleic-acid-binding Zn-ribbon protein
MSKNCEKCGSDKIVPRAKVIDRGSSGAEKDLTISIDADPEAFVFKQRIRSDVIAKVCGNCGFIEFYAMSPESLYESYLKSKI